MAHQHLSTALFTFLRDLAANNDRAWFKANKSRYDEVVKDPCLAFVADFASPLVEVSDFLVADPKPVGGSMFRLHRDTRFAKDKTPFKTHVGIQFRHEAANDAHAPGIYVHLEPNGCFVGAGIWHPDTKSRRAVHEHILAHPDAWRAAAHEGPFGSRFDLTGESLKRPPAGVDADHPHVVDLKRKDFIGVMPLKQKDVTSAGFLDQVAGCARDAAPFLRFLCEALDLGF